jgi:hypothetical protein
MSTADFDTDAIKHHAERDALPVAGTLSIMARAACDTIGAERWQNALNKAWGIFASKGVIGWRPDDAATLMDVIPLPDPYVGQWGYRLQFAHQVGKEMHVVKIIIPYSEISR